jgi:hypothetical protein
MTRRASVTAAPTSPLLCSACGYGIPAKFRDGTDERICFGCIRGAVERHDRIAAVAEADRIVGEARAEEEIVDRAIIRRRILDWFGVDIEAA